MMDKIISEYMSEQGRRGGSAKSEAKTAASAKNGSERRPHFLKVGHFKTIFRHELVENEWKDKFPVGLTPKGRISTYNPDYYCPVLKAYIEVTTSKSNISEQGNRWREAIRRGLSLRIFWWEGQEITGQFANGAKGGRPRKATP
jgi:hypothetical protein